MKRFLALLFTGLLAVNAHAQVITGAAQPSPQTGTGSWVRATAPIITAKIRVVTASGAVTVAATDYIVAVNKTTGAATTVNLPSSPTTGQTFVIKDAKGDAFTNNITVTPASGNIDGASTFVMNVNRQSITVVYDGTQWDIL